MLKRPNTVTAILSILLPVMGFVVILFSLNLYQYSRVKSDIAAGTIAETSNIELIELQNFFKDITDSLKVAREWGKNGIFNLSETVALNKKLFPLMHDRTRPTGLLLADSSGQEYFLYRTRQGLVTRISGVGNNSTRQVWQRWVTPEQKEKQWQEETEYDPRTRPWFTAPGNEERVSWTKPYAFFQSGKPGITASVSWIEPDAPDRYMVFGLDLLVEDIQDMLNKQQDKREGILFLVHPEAGYTIESSISPSNVQADRYNAADQKEIIAQAIATWKTGKKLSDKTVSFTYRKQKWLVRFQHLGDKTNPIWVGVAASEKNMTAPLKKTLFKIDMTDFLVAVAGGFALLFLFRRFGRRTSTGPSQTRPLQPDTLMEQINKGEGPHLEFKSSVRYNLKTEKNGKEIELAWLKAVVAFLNSTGGTLLLGVADDSTIVGIAHDNFENNDRCLLHVKNLLNQHIGAVFFPLLNITLVDHSGWQVIAIECRQAAEPVFLKVGKTEEFYIRSGPSNTKLSPSQIISYLEQNRS